MGDVQQAVLADVGEPSTIYVDDELEIVREVRTEGGVRLRWRGPEPWRPRPGRAGVARPLDGVLVRIRASVGGPVLDQGLRPLRDGLAAPISDPVAALSLCGKLCHLVAELHDEGYVHAGLDFAAIWSNDHRERLALLPREPFAEHAPITAARREAILRRQDPACRHPSMDGTDAVFAERRLDLHALGVMCSRILTGLDLPPMAADTRSPPSGAAQATAAALGADPPAIAIEVVRCLLRNEGPRYETARGAALDFLECATALRSEGTVADFPLGRQDGAPALRMPKELFGRREELTRLREAYAAARGRARSVFLSGAPGVGKTRLVEEFRRDVDAAGGCFAGGKSDQTRVDAPLSSLSEAIGAMALWIKARPKRLRKAWVRRLRAMLGSDAAVIGALSPRFARLLGVTGPPPPLPPLEARNRLVFAMLRLIRAMARRSHPLCVFLDDLQWVDEGTIDLLEAVAADPSLNGFVFVGVYRGSEVDAEHPLARAIARQSRGNYPPVVVELGPLGHDEAARMVAVALRRKVRHVAQLTRTLDAVAGGNPFFLAQLLRSLAAAGVVVYDFRRARWRWSDPDVAALELDPDVVAVVLARLRFLSAECRRMLGYAARLGRKASVSTLSLVCRVDPAALRRALTEATDQGVLGRRTPAGAEAAGVEEYAFTHDRLQQAALELLEAGETAAAGLRVGLALIGSEELSREPALVPVALAHLNAAEREVSDPALRLRIAELSLAEGRRARESLAFAEAHRKLEAGLRWLPEDAWSAFPELTFQLHAECFQAAHQAGETERADALFADLTARMRDPVEIAGVIAMRVLLDTAARRYEDVWSHARAALRALGERLPERAGFLALLREHLGVKLRMTGRPIESIANLPATRDPRSRRAIEVLASALPAIYFLNPRLTMLCGMRIASMSLRGGLAPHSAIGFAIVGLGAASALEQYAVGHAWGRAAVAAADRHGGLAVRARTRLIFGGFVNFWRESFDSSQRLLAEAYEAAMEAGDHQYALYAIQQRAMLGMFHGRTPPAVLADNRRALPFVAQARDPFAIEGLAIWTRAAEQLIHGREPAERGARRLARLDAMGNPTILAYHHVAEARLAMMFGDAEGALTAAQAALGLKMALLGQIPVVDAEFAAGVASAQLLAVRPSRALRAQLSRSLARLRLRARHAPSNFGPHLLLLEAEAAAADRRADAVLGRFDAAIGAASTGGFPDVAGLAARGAAAAAERMGLNRRIVEAYRADADQHFEQWGAPALRSPSARAAQAKSRRAASPGAVAQALSLAAGDEPRVLALLDAAAQEAHAEFAAFVGFEDDEPRVHAICAGGRAEMTGPDRGALADNPAILPAIIDLVRADGREHAIEDVGADPRFEPTDAPGAPRAVLCAPALDGAMLSGALFLAASEPRRFAAATRHAARLAAAEIAVALARRAMRRALGANERALGSAARRIRTLTQSSATLASFLPRRLGVQADGRGEPSERIVTAMFIDIQNYTGLVERHGAAAVDTLMERRFSLFYDEVAQRDGDFATTIGDAILAVFGDQPGAAPQATRAVAAAIAVSAAARAADVEALPGEPRIVVNIAIETGLAVARVAEFGAGDAKRRSFSVVGASVNVASRLVSHARDGAILIGPSARARLPANLPVRALGALRLRNVTTPVEVFELDASAIERDASPDRAVREGQGEVAP